MSDPRSSVELRAKLDEATAAQAAAKAKCDARDAQRPAAVRQGVDALASHDAARQVAGRELDVANAAATDAAAALSVAQAREKDDADRAAYDRANAAREPLIVKAQRVQRKINAEVQSLVEDLRQFDSEIRAVNRNLPAGRDPLPALERDDRLNAGEVYESHGLSVGKRLIAWPRADFWLRLEPAPAAEPAPSSQPARPPHPITDAKPGKSIQPKFCSLPLPSEPPAADLSTFKPKVLHGRG